MDVVTEKKAENQSTTNLEKTHKKQGDQTNGIPGQTNDKNEITPTDNDNNTEQETNSGKENDILKSQLEVDHPDETILLERVAYVDESDNQYETLTILHQTILLAMCLDVKDSNAMDGLTAEQMLAYLERILTQHDDWMVYATALLERAWLEFERTHGRERAILQIQALADQHTNRLTLTQSTYRAAVEDSAPAQRRLRNLHALVYPPRWEIIRDLADRYAKLGIVTSAAELYEEIELWDDVVECYRAAGKEGRAERVVRDRLEHDGVETPRMRSALGDITGDISHYERALVLSKGRFVGAHVSLGLHWNNEANSPSSTSNNDDHDRCSNKQKELLQKATQCFRRALEIKPLQPTIWFRLGTIYMRLQQWDEALRAFTEVVLQEPEEGDAWANIAAIHMHNKNPAEAYPGLVESLKRNRNNWRVWVSKLYTCIDLDKFDEAIQACHQLMDMSAKKHQNDKASSSNNNNGSSNNNNNTSIPRPEEKCIRAIVGGALREYNHAVAIAKANENGDSMAAVDSARRTLSRVETLLQSMTTTMRSSESSWLYEVNAFFHSHFTANNNNDKNGSNKVGVVLVLDDLMKEYRALQTTQGWEMHPERLSKLCGVVQHMGSLLMEEYKKQQQNDESKLEEEEDWKERIIKFKFLINNVIKKVRKAYMDNGNDDNIPKELNELELLMTDVTKYIT